MSTILMAPTLSPIFFGVGWRINDESIQPADYRTSPPQTTGSGNLLRDSDILWPRSSFPGQNSAAGFQNGVADPAHQYWEWNFPPTGVHVRKMVSGMVIDANGSGVSGATVQLFNTATGTLVDTQTTDAGGNYRCGDPNAVACFAVGYLSGSPDEAGTTVDTLTGS